MGDESVVTAEWLEAVLASYHVYRAGPGTEPPHVAVSDFTTRPGCDDSENVLSDILAVSVDYTLPPDTSQLTLSLIVKLLPNDPFSRFFVTEAQFDLREIKFYTQVVPDLVEFQKRRLGEDERLNLPIPQCYHARYQEGCESVLVLENLKTRGFAGAEFSQGLTQEQTEAALVAVARLHALSLALKVVDGLQLEDHYPFLFQTARATDSYQHLVERGLPQLARFLELRPGFEAVLERLRALKPSTKELIAELLAPEEPLALITHTDFWCNNLLFNGTDCAILDWQMVTYSRPTNDVALLLVSSVPTELRREHTDHFLDTYWSALTVTASRLGVDVETGLGYDRVSLSRDYRRSQLLALLLCIGSVDVALGDPLTEQRLLDLLQDLHQDGVLTPSTSVPPRC